MPSDATHNSSKLLDALAAREGHFLLESGLHAEAWLDLDTLLLDSKALTPHITALAALISRHRISAVCGPLIGGAFVAQAIALQLGIRFYFTERVATTPQPGLFQAVYQLPHSQRVRAATERFAVVDDVIGAGSAVRATVGELASLGATTVAIGALLTLGRKAENHLAPLGIPVEALGSREIAMWEPALCPRCQAGIPLERP